MYYVTGNDTLAYVSESLENADKERYLMEEMDYTQEQAELFAPTLYDVSEYLENGNTGDYGPCIPASNEAEALEQLGGVKAELGEFDSLDDALAAFKSYERSDIELNPMNVNGTVSPYFELENGDILEISNDDPDGEFPPKDEKNRAAWEDGIAFRAVIYDRDDLAEELRYEYGDITNAIVTEDVAYSTSLHDFKDLDLTGGHTVKDSSEKEPFVTFSIEDAVMSGWAGEEYADSILYARGEKSLDDVIADADEKSEAQEVSERPDKAKDDLSINRLGAACWKGGIS